MKFPIAPTLSKEELYNYSQETLSKIQKDILDQIREFMEKNHMTQTDFGRYLGFSKGYMTQLFKGNCDHKLSTMILLMLSIGKVPKITFEDFSPSRTSV